MDKKNNYLKTKILDQSDYAIFESWIFKPLTDKSVGSDSLRLEKSNEEIFSSEQAEFSPYDKNASFSQPWG